MLRIQKNLVGFESLVRGALRVPAAGCCVGFNGLRMIRFGVLTNDEVTKKTNDMVLLLFFAIPILFVVAVFLLVRRGRTHQTTRRRVKTMVVLGSGGHTAEILSLLGVLNLEHYSPLFFVVAATDSISADNVQRSGLLVSYPKVFRFFLQVA